MHFYSNVTFVTIKVTTANEGNLHRFNILLCMCPLHIHIYVNLHKVSFFNFPIPYTRDENLFVLKGTFFFRLEM